MAKLVNSGETQVLNTYLKGTARPSAGNLYLGLYTDVSEPGETANLATITELPVANGYARVALADAGWTVADDQAAQPQKTFTANGGDWGNVTGYLICDAVSGNGANLLFVEHFSDGPYNMLDGMSCKISPVILAA